MRGKSIPAKVRTANLQSGSLAKRQSVDLVPLVTHVPYCNDFATTHSTNNIIASNDDGCASFVGSEERRPSKE